MNHLILDDGVGDLMFWLTDPENEVPTLQEMVARGGYVDHEWFGEYFCNEEFDWVYPEELGALTGDGNPIFGIVDRDDRTNDLLLVHSLWCYEAYQLRYAVEDLLRNGVTVFQRAY